MRSAVYPEYSRRGYTLIELLVVIAIISTLAVVGVVNFKGFSSDQVIVKAIKDIQSYLRLAQSNATSSTLCNSQGTTSWSIVFLNSTTIELRCDPANFPKNTYTLNNAEIESIIGSSCGGASTMPLTLSYSPGVGDLTFKSSTALSDCLKSSSWTMKIKNKIDTSKYKEFKLSKGGAIDVN